VRFYAIDGEVYPSVTTVLSVISKPALIAWAAKVVAQAAVANLDRLAGMSPEEAVTFLKSVPTSDKESAARRGTQVHKLLECIVKGGVVDIDQQSAPYVSALQRFLKSTDLHVDYSEVVCYNKTVGYAGTIDVIGKLDGKVVILDIKTSSAVYPEYELQLAAYRGAEFLYLQPNSLPMPQVEECYILHLQPGKFELVRMEAGPRAMDAFVAAAKLFAYLQAEGVADGLR
jgi:hypothetical protein